MNSLKNNLAYNQNRQKDSIKFFEIADIYTKSGQEKRMAALVNGRSNKNFKEFNAQLDYAYLKGLLNTIVLELLGEELTYSHDSCDEYEFFEHIDFKGKDIGGIGKLNNSLIDSKSKTPVFAFEISLENLNLSEKKIEKTSDFPAIFRDISMSIDNPEVFKELSGILAKSIKKMPLVKESFIFDYFENKKLNVMKFGYRFKFQLKIKA
jgi:Phenylalanyl-tRNA synthetase beta subunit